MAVFDYSAARPNVAGCEGVVRYAGAYATAFNISSAEFQALQRQNVPVGIVVEQDINAIFGGRSRGQQLANAAQANTHAAGVPDGLLYVACDTDATNGGPTSPGSPGDRQMGKVADTLAGVADVVGWQNVGFYGSHFAGDWLFSHAVPIAAFWQTEAWSHGLRHPRAVLFQRAGAPAGTPAGADWNDVLGDWRPRTRRSAPTPGPGPAPLGSLPLTVDGVPGRQTYAALQRATGASVDGVLGIDTWRHIQARVGVPQDGVPGPVTWRAVQAHVGAGVDGTPGPDTWRHVQSALNARRF